MKIENLPDYAALCQIRDALWEVGDIRGAAVMVGAGFSRMAIRDSSSTPMPPLWSTFFNEMKRSLPNCTTNDALDLAEEYKAFLGASALESLIKKLVPDEKWKPSQIHSELMGLPWQDVLTTNWDTLLERTEPKDPEISYETVRQCSDIARTRSRRIVKLHGSLPSNSPFIFTAEDYRTYPRRFSPFVNLAQQVLMENELCLIGFSGDDPNFKAWSGWVRDQLGEAARPIRLIGVLDLPPSRRRFLEGLNVTPIDLAPLVSELNGADRHESATRQLLEWLWASRPKARHSWHLEPNPFQNWTGTDKLQALTEVWQRERVEYPGWAVAPSSYRYWLISHTGSHLRDAKALFDAATPELKGKFAFELSWRYQISLEPMTGWPDEAAEWAATNSSSGLARADRIRITEAQLRQARLTRNWQRFGELIARLDDLEPNSQEAAYERALKEKDNFNYPEVERLLADISSTEPLWRLRKSGLLGFLDQGPAAMREAVAALRELQRRRSKDRKSIELMSLEAWAAFLARISYYDSGDAGAAIKDEIAQSGQYAAARCDPWAALESFDRSVSELRERRINDAKTIEPQFDAGSYRDNSSGIRIVSSDASTVLANYLLLCDHIGLSSRIGHFDVAGGRARKILGEISNPQSREIYAALEHISSYSEGLINYYFDRLSVSKMDINLVREIVKIIESSLEYASDRTRAENARWVEFLRVRTEILSRLVLRLDADEAKSLFHWAIARLRDDRWRHWWLYKSLGNLLSRTIETIPPLARTEIIFAAVDAPLTIEKGEEVGLNSDWPELQRDLVGVTFKRPPNDHAWGKRIGELLALLRRRDSGALWWLVLLHKSNALTVSEAEALSDAVWQGVSPGDFPPYANIRHHVYFELPNVDAARLGAAFQKHVVAPLTSGAISEGALDVGQAAGSRSPKLAKFTKEEALAALPHLLAWRPRPVPKWDHGYVQASNEAIQSRISTLLADVILPQLELSDLPEGMREELLQAFESEGHCQNLVIATELLRICPDAVECVRTALRAAIATRNDKTIRWALWSVERLLKAGHFEQDSPISAFAQVIVDHCVYARDPGLRMCLRLSRILVEQGKIRSEKIADLLLALKYLYAEFTYENWNSTDPRTHELTLIRAECVRLSAALSSAGHKNEAIQSWLGAAPNDPTPEVRFALMPDGGIA